MIRSIGAAPSASSKPDGAGTPNANPLSGQDHDSSATASTSTTGYRPRSNDSTTPARRSWTSALVCFADQVPNCTWTPSGVPTRYNANGIR